MSTTTIDKTSEVIDLPRTLQVFTSAQTPGPKRELVSVAARNGKNPDGTKREVAQHDRLRCIIIPELTVDGVPSKYQSILLDALRRVAKDQLDSFWQQDSAMRTVPAVVWNVDSLLLFAAREAESKRLTKATLEAWFDDSDICRRLMAAGNAQKLAKAREKVVGLAAAVCDFSEDSCTIWIVNIGKADAGEDNIIGQQLIAKLTRRQEALRKQLEEVEEEI